MVAVLVVLILGLAAEASAQRLQTAYRDPREFFGPHFEGGQDAPRPERSRGEDAVRRWNEILLVANALDHTPVRPEETRVFGEQLGPHRTSRAFAIVHIAIFDAANAIAGGHKSYTGLPPASRGVSMSAAIAQAAHDTLAELYPSQKPSFDELLAGGLIIVLSWHYRETTAENLIRTARAMSDAVDREFSDSVASLEVLASSPLLDPGDHRGFHQRLVAVSESLGWTEATVEVTPRWP